VVALVVVMVAVVCCLGVVEVAVVGGRRCLLVLALALPVCGLRERCSEKFSGELRSGQNTGVEGERASPGVPPSPSPLLPSPPTSEQSQQQQQ
jgi:hypothetical protein